MMLIYGLMRHYFRHGVSAYVYWNIALEGDASSTWGWRQNSLITVDGGKAQLNPEYYMMKHFSHFVKRGARYIQMQGDMSTLCTAFENPDGQRIVVAYNPYPHDITVTIEGKSYLLPVNTINTIVI